MTRRSTLHFVVSPRFNELAAGMGGYRLGENYPYWVGGRFNWAAQSYLVLREHREGVTFGVTPLPGVINFGHSMEWHVLGVRQAEFRIGVRADYPRVYDVNFEILQNPAEPLSARQAYLPYWPIPGLVPRSSVRAGIKTIAYAGRIGARNLALEIASSSSDSSLKGVRFMLIPHARWHDMSEIDLLVAIRGLDRRRHSDKPPNKLFNAWRASIPLIAGYDSAFSAIAEPGREYVRVDTIEGFFAEVARLRNDPAAYARLVEMGRARASGVSHESLARVWLDVIDRRVTPQFETWCASGGDRRRVTLAYAVDRMRDIAVAAKARLKGRDRNAPAGAKS